MTDHTKAAIRVLFIFALGMALQRWLLQPNVPDEPVPAIVLPDQVFAEPGVFFRVKAESKGSVVRWVLDPGMVAADAPLTDYFMAKKPGRYQIRAYTATRGWLPWSRAEPSELAVSSIAVGEVPPGPGPLPPDPKPSVNPFPGSPPGLRVLIIYDQTKVLPKEIQPILTSTKLRSFLDANCAKQGGWPEYRFFDKSTPLGNESALWQGAFAKCKDKPLPTLAIGNGPSGFEGLLPDSVDGVIAAVQKYVAPQRSELDIPWPKQRLPPRKETQWALGV